MLKNLLFILSLFFFANTAIAQSTPQPLVSGINVQRLFTIRNSAIRIVKEPVTGNLLYALTNGNVYMIKNVSGVYSDTLLYTSSDHGVSYLQGMRVHDSTLFVSGNNNSSTALTTGIIAKGKMNASGNRVWTNIMVTDQYQTADYFDHLFSGLAISPDGDTAYICSGARGDHGEVQTRYGAFPGLRNTPLTTNIYAIPTSPDTTIVLRNDQQWNDTSAYVYCRGIRNTFDMSFDGNGYLFGVENSGDRDHNEEMNWLQRGEHYGFPWKMGDSYNPQQFPSFDPNNDPLIPRFSRSWRIGAWSNDPAFPAQPSGITFRDPIQNFGPDCDKYRDSVTAQVVDASDNNTSIGTFTAHRSPLGLVFDKQNLLSSPYQGDGFMLSWTKGLDSTGQTTNPDTAIGPFSDPSEDLVHLDLRYNSSVNNFSLNATRIVSDFSHPVDAVIDSNTIYVIENGYGNTSGLFAVTFPAYRNCSATITLQYIDPCQVVPLDVVIDVSANDSTDIIVKDSTGLVVDSGSNVVGTYTLAGYAPGRYYVLTSNETGCSDSVSFLIPVPAYLNIDSTHLASCGSCNDGVVYFDYFSATPPYLYSVTPQAGTFSSDSLSGLPGGEYIICITDALGCSLCDTVNILTVGLTNTEVDNWISVYPNPAETEISLVVPSVLKDVQIECKDILGRVAPVLMVDKNMSESTMKLRFDISALTPGVYHIDVNADDKLYKTSLFIKK